MTATTNGSRNGTRPVEPPHNLEAEESVLGCAIRDPDALGWLATHLDPLDFYRPEHRRIAALLVELHNDGIPVTPSAVLTVLRERGVLADVGGGPFLLTLDERAPAASNVGWYGRRVRATSRQRQAMDLVRQLEGACRDGLDGEQVAAIAVDQFQRFLDDAAGDDGVTGPDGMLQSLRELRDRRLAGDRVSWHLENLDALTGGLEPGQMVIVAARPGAGKSAIGLQVCALVAEGQRTAFISFEMSRSQIARRQLALYAHINTDAAVMSVDDDRLAPAREAYRSLDIVYLDGEQDLDRTLAQVRALHARRPFRLVAVDYAQLIPVDPARYKTREQEVAAISRSLKLLAKRLHVPVLVLAQLNRDADGRVPTLRDLRECVVGSTVIYSPVSGRRSTVEELYRLGRPFEVLALDDAHRLVVATAEGVVRSGRKSVFRVRTRTGRTFTASANHPVLTFDGWQPVDQLRPGAEIAAPRWFPVDPSTGGGLHPDVARLLGYLVSDGSYCRHRSVAFIASEGEIIADAASIAEQHIGVAGIAKPHHTGIGQVEFRVPGGFGPGRNPMVNWLRALGIHGQRGPEKTTPAAVFEAGQWAVAEYLAGLWAGDGTVVWSEHVGTWVVKYVSTSMRLLREIQHLLLRLGVISAVQRPTRHTKSTVDIAVLQVSGAGPVAAFAERIPVPGRKGLALRCAAEWAAASRSKSKVDLLPLGASQHALAVRDRQVWGNRGASIFSDRRLTRAKAAMLGERYADDILATLASSDVLWDQVVSVDPAGEEETYDLVVPGRHNFVADDVVLHNSGQLEQDADVVVFLHDEGDEGTLAVVAKNRDLETNATRLRFDKPRTTFYDDHRALQS